MLVWRISKRRHVETAFSGEGARLASGRWNPLGIPMVYTSSSLSLAAMEVFVHVDPEEEPDDLIAIAAEVPGNEALPERIQPVDLPLHWRTMPQVTAALGAEWAVSRRSLMLLVPSAAIDGEWNVLLNPNHLAAKELRVIEPKPFRFDPRMFKRVPVTPVI